VGWNATPILDNHDDYIVHNIDTIHPCIYNIYIYIMVDFTPHCSLKKICLIVSMTRFNTFYFYWLPISVGRNAHHAVKLGSRQEKMRFRAEVLIELKRICQQWVQEAGAIFIGFWKTMGIPGKSLKKWWHFGTRLCLGIFCHDVSSFC